MQYLQPYLHLVGFLPSAALTALCYLVLRRARASMWRVALLALPGTIAHELAHFVVGFLLLAKPSGFSVWPRRAGRHWLLGSVDFHAIGLLNAAFVALAPLLLLPLAWLCLVRLAVPCWVSHQWGWWLAAAYLTATMVFAALPSLQDIKLGSRSLLFYGSIVGALWGLSFFQS